jgi:hypothetical protein
LSIEIDQCLPTLALEIFDILRLVQNKVVPSFPLEGESILHSQLI